MTVEKPKPKQLFRPITSGTNSTMNQSQFLAIVCNSLKVRGKSRVHGAIGFGFTSHWPVSLFGQSQSRNYFRQSFENCSNEIITAYILRITVADHAEVSVSFSSIIFHWQ